jgi:predicted dienelactone hydrolase
VRRPIAALLFLALASRALAADPPQPYKAAPGPFAVATLVADWQDPARHVTVPVKLYYPKNIADLPASAPLILFSHGLGGSREGYAFWADHWASHGYLVLLPTHVGSDTAALLGRGNDAGPAGRGVMQAAAAAANAENAARRCQDISFLLDQAEKINNGTLPDPALAPFKGKIDLAHIGMAGHSFGAQTTLSVAGELFPPAARPRSAADRRITAAVAMSPQPAKALSQDVAFGSIKIPILHLTGTADDAPIGDVVAADRRIPFDHSTAKGTTLLIFKGATHGTFAPAADGSIRSPRLRQLGARRDGAPATQAASEADIHTLIKESTTAFWDAHLKNDTAAAAWLADDLPRLVGAAGTLEHK